MEHDQSSYFWRGPGDFCWGPAPVGPTLVTGPKLVALRIDIIMCFVFDMHAYFKLFLHAFHAYQCKWPIGSFVQ